MTSRSTTPPPPAWTRPGSSLGGDCKEPRPRRASPSRQGGRACARSPTAATTRSSRVGFAYGDALRRSRRSTPTINFAIVDGSAAGATNVTDLVFAEDEGSFLVGVAAALKTQDRQRRLRRRRAPPLIQKFEAGYVAGAKAVNPDIKVDVKYITQPPRLLRLQRPGQGQDRRAGHVRRRRRHRLPRGRWVRPRRLPGAPRPQSKRAIGVDSDQYLTAPPPAGRDPDLDAQARRHRGLRLDQVLRRRHVKGGFQTSTT